MKRRVLLPLLMIPLFAPFSVAAPQTSHSTQAAWASTSQGPKWTEANKKALFTKAQHGDARAQFWLGTAYEQGWFEKADFQKALKWLRRAAKHGDPDAQNALGGMCEDGEGVPRNYAQAAKWYRKAAEHVPDFGGAGQGRNNLGLLYMGGLGVPKDFLSAQKSHHVANFQVALPLSACQKPQPGFLHARKGL